MSHFETTYKENYSRMFCAVYKMVGDKDVVRDIIQEVFAAYYEKTMSGNQISRPASWLLRAALNKSIDHLNRQTRYLQLSAANYPEEEKNDAAEQEEMQKILRQAFTKLSSKEIKLAVLYSEGFSYKEIAEYAGINFSSVGKTLSRTLQKLKVILKEMNYEMY